MDIDGFISAHEPTWNRLQKLSTKGRKSVRSLDAAEVDELIDRKTAHAYEDAVTRVEDLANLYELADRHDHFTDFVTSLRNQHAAKRKFIAMLDAADIDQA